MAASPHSPSRSGSIRHVFAVARTHNVGTNPILRPAHLHLSFVRQFPVRRNNIPRPDLPSLLPIGFPNVPKIRKRSRKPPVRTQRNTAATAHQRLAYRQKTDRPASFLSFRTSAALPVNFKSSLKPFGCCVLRPDQSATAASPRRPSALSGTAHRFRARLRNFL